MDLSQIQRAKVSEERLVNQVVVDAEVERMGAGLRRVLVRDPVQSVVDNLD